MAVFTFRRTQRSDRTFFVLLHTSAAPDAAGWDAYVDALRQSLPESKGRMHLFVATDGGGPNPEQRRSLATALAHVDTLTHVFTTGLVVRSIVTAFRWLGGSACAYHPNEFPRACLEAGHSPGDVLSLFTEAQCDLSAVATLRLMRVACASDHPRSMLT